jgi:hypothetical protein
MELTVKQIQEKQKQLNKDLRDRLNKFEQETGLYVKGEINRGYTDGKDQHWLSLKYSNPFM